MFFVAINSLLFICLIFWTIASLPFFMARFRLKDAVVVLPVQTDDAAHSYWREAPAMEWARGVIREPEQKIGAWVPVSALFFILNAAIVLYYAHTNNHSLLWAAIPLATAMIVFAGRVCMLQASHFSMAELVNKRTQDWFAEKVQTGQAEMIDLDGKEVIKIPGHPA